MHNKTCSKCNEEKAYDCFYISARSKDGRQTQCKECMKHSYVKCRTTKKQHYIDVTAKRRQKNRERLQTWKKQQKCEHCGISNHIVLELHHIDPQQKDINISEAVYGWSWKKLLTEIAKCKVLCANCHRIEHHKLRCD